MLPVIDGTYRGCTDDIWPEKKNVLVDMLFIVACWRADAILEKLL
jgi:hypothetical protein